MGPQQALRLPPLGTLVLLSQTGCPPLCASWQRWGESFILRSVVFFLFKNYWGRDVFPFFFQCSFVLKRMDPRSL